MSNFQRLVAIPQDEYTALLNVQNVKQPLGHYFNNLSKEYVTEERETDPYRRLLLQSNTLDQMKQVKEQMRNSLSISTPKPYQSRAKALLQTLESVLKFNSKGEIYSDDGNLIDGSRLEDLIQHAVRDRRRNLTPTGWSDFLTILRNHNVPKSLLNRYTLDEMEESKPSEMTQARPKIVPVKRNLKIKEDVKGILPKIVPEKRKLKIKEEVEDILPKQSKTVKEALRLQPRRKKKPTNQDFDFLKKYGDA